MMGIPSRGSKANNLCKPITLNLVTPADEPRSVIVIKTIKYILYQRQQIPFTYEFLMDLARKGKIALKESSGNDHKPGHRVSSRDLRTLKKKYRKVVESYEMLEEMFKNVHEELDLCGNHAVPEVMIVLGTTPMSPKEVYRIILPQYSCRSSEKDTHSKTNVYQMFRGIMTCEELQEFVTKSLSTTNTFLFIKKRAGMSSQWLLPKKIYEPPNMGQHIIFSLKGSAKNEQAMKEAEENQNIQEMSIYCDGSPVNVKSCKHFTPEDRDRSESVLTSNFKFQNIQEERAVDNSLKEMHWYQAKQVFKGFVNNLKL